MKGLIPAAWNSPKMALLMRSMSSKVSRSAFAINGTTFVTADRRLMKSRSAVLMSGKS